jgi:hypothetical protein
MWSQRKSDGTNKSPSSTLRRLSTRLWEEMLGVIKPKLVITAGAIARDVIRPIWAVEKQINLRLPSPPAMAILAGRTDENALCGAQESINKLTMKYPVWFQNNRRFKALYIWHAMDKVKERKHLDA